MDGTLEIDELVSGNDCNVGRFRSFTSTLSETSYEEKWNEIREKVSACLDNASPMLSFKRITTCGIDKLFDIFSTYKHGIRIIGPRLKELSFGAIVACHCKNYDHEIIDQNFLHMRESLGNLIRGITNDFRVTKAHLKTLRIFHMGAFYYNSYNWRTYGPTMLTKNMSDITEMLLSSNLKCLTFPEVYGSGNNYIKCIERLDLIRVGGADELKTFNSFASMSFKYLSSLKIIKLPSLWVNFNLMGVLENEPLRYVVNRAQQSPRAVLCAREKSIDGKTPICSALAQKLSDNKHGYKHMRSAIKMVVLANKYGVKYDGGWCVFRLLSKDLIALLIGYIAEPMAWVNTCVYDSDGGDGEEARIPKKLKREGHAVYKASRKVEGLDESLRKLDRKIRRTNTRKLVLKTQLSKDMEKYRRLKKKIKSNEKKEVIFTTIISDLTDLREKTTNQLKEAKEDCEKSRQIYDLKRKICALTN